MRLRSPLWGWGWGWSTHVLLSGSFVWPSLPAYFFTYIAFLPVHNLLTSMSQSSLEFPGLCLASVHSSHVHYMNVALQLVNWWLILACLSGTKWPSRSHVFFFDDAIRESSSFTSKCFRNNGKTKEKFKFIAYEERCSWVASNWVWEKPDLLITFFKTSSSRWLGSAGEIAFMICRWMPFSVNKKNHFGTWKLDWTTQ